MKADRRVLVTGGTVRLGKAIADCLRARGWRVIVSSHRPDAAADVIADLSDPLGAPRLYAAAAAAAGGELDAIVNNAALFAGDPQALEQVNFEAPRKLATLLAGRETGVGAVVNVLDTRVLAPPGRDEGPYAASKRRLLEFTRSGAALFAASLRMNAVAPGPVLAPVGVHEKAGELLLSHRPTPSDVAVAVAWLLEAEATTGAVIPVDGGQFLLP